MKATIFDEFGGPEKLIYREVPTPKPGHGEVLVRVRACALNHLDIWIRQGIPAYKINLPHISGSDLSGIVEEVGPEVEGFAPGDPVVIFPGLSCWRCEFCLSGNDNLCVQYRIVGAGSDGGYAEFCVLPAINLLPKPKRLSFEEAAAYPLTYLTAWHMLIGRCGLRAGQDLLVLAAGSGVGGAALQIGKLIGARVIATASTDEKLLKAKQMGADEVINYSESDFAEEVKRITGGRGVDIVFEHVGPATFEKSLKSLAKNGKLVTCGATTGPRTEIDLRYIYSRQLSLLGSIMGRRAEMGEITRLMASGKLRPTVDSVFPLSEARAAQEKLLSRDLFGKIILVPSEIAPPRG